MQGREDYSEVSLRIYSVLMMNHKVKNTQRKFIYDVYTEKLLLGISKVLYIISTIVPSLENGFNVRVPLL